MSNSPILDLVGQWNANASTLRQYGAESHAQVLESCAQELQETLHGSNDTLLTLAQAADHSGYSADHLGRLVREGKIPNAGRHGAPRILRRDLPVKAGWVAPPERNEQIDRTQIVRSAISSGD